MIGAQRRQAAMRDGHQRAGRSGCELDFNFRLLIRGEVCVAPGEFEAAGRVPDLHPADLDDVRRAVLVE